MRTNVIQNLTKLYMYIYVTFAQQIWITVTKMTALDASFKDRIIKFYIEVVGISTVVMDDICG